jgi:hypothetical protein
MAGAVHRTRMPSGSYSVDHEGVGSASAAWANRILVAGDGTYGGYRHGSLNGATGQSVQVLGGQTIRVALAWNSRAGGSGNLTRTDTLASDLDVRIRLPNGTVVGSYTLDNSYEHLTVTSPVAGTAVIEVIPARLSAGSQRFALAWSKIGGDGRPPTVVARAPADGEPWAAASSALTVTFSEPVTGLVGSSVVLTRLDGSAVPAALAYDPTARRLTVDPGGLGAGAYRLSLTDHIRDHAGNRLAGHSTTFSVTPSGGSWTTPLAPARQVLFSGGSHTGYRFDASGNVTGSRSATLARASGALAGTRATIPGRPGRWLAITNGIWAGYWVRESPRAGLAGSVESQSLPGTTRIILASGSHTGYRFDAGGRVIATKTAPLASTSGANLNGRGVINGRTYLAVTNGIWAGYWVPESSRSYVAGLREHRDMLGRTTRFSAGTHVGHRFDAAGTIVGSRSGTLSRGSGAPAIAWAIVNGAPRFLIGAGVWAGYWVPESGSVLAP